MLLLWIVRLVFFYLILRGIIRLVGGIIDGLQTPGSAQPPAVPLARDPVCGTFVVPSRALTAGSGSETRFFCSENCRRVYAAKHAS